MSLFKSICAIAAVFSALTFFGGTAFAQTGAGPIEVKNAWVRSTVPGQKGTGAFMSITAKNGATLVGVSSPVAGLGEVHEMKMEGDVMKMRAMPNLNLPAGTAVELKPGGYHVMLLDLKSAVLPGSKVPVTLRFKDSKGLESQLELNLEVRTSVPLPIGDKTASHATGHKH